MTEKQAAWFLAHGECRGKQRIMEFTDGYCVLYCSCEKIGVAFARHGRTLSGLQPVHSNSDIPRHCECEL